MTIDANLSPDTREYLLSLAGKQRRLVGSSTSHEQKSEGEGSHDASPVQ